MPATKFKHSLIWIGICILVGMLASYLQFDALREWYPFLEKPALTPPGWVFFVVWTVLYIMMGLSIALVRWGRHPHRRLLTIVFIVQLTVNFLWSVAFFMLRNPTGGLTLIVILFLLLLLYIHKSWQANRFSSCLFIPYLAWVGFAFYLNLYIVLYN
ncbi:MAG: tryptophan-rich sensory protein [Desulfovibrionaceae bacterium]|nr:tryptophan-rich sensory protein [Desulfovibrionaceae bacterium]